ncbi:hypothetical protein B0H13DRAFT_2331055 [Mycena leptocephala]|nr:hypothetical protein B0H13DRAFT_2331055 [Mycena leptocephala]
MSDATSEIPPPLEPVTQEPADKRPHVLRQIWRLAAEHPPIIAIGTWNWNGKGRISGWQRMSPPQIPVGLLKSPPFCRLRTRVLNDDRIKEMHAKRARESGVGYRARKAHQLAQDQRNRRQEAYCDKHGTKAWIVRAAKHRGRAATEAQHGDPQQAVAGESTVVLTARQRHQLHRQRLQEEAEILAREIVWRRERKAKKWDDTLTIWDELCARHHGDGCPVVEIPSPPDSPPRRRAPSTPTLPCAAATLPSSSPPRALAITINVSTSVRLVHRSSAVPPTTPRSRTVTSASSLTSGTTQTISPRTQGHRARDDGRDLDETMARLNLVDHFSAAGLEGEGGGNPE